MVVAAAALPGAAVHDGERRTKEEEEEGGGEERWSTCHSTSPDGMAYKGVLGVGTRGTNAVEEEEGGLGSDSRTGRMEEGVGRWTSVEEVPTSTSTSSTSCGSVCLRSTRFIGSSIGTTLTDTPWGGGSSSPSPSTPHGGDRCASRLLQTISASFSTFVGRGHPIGVGCPRGHRRVPLSSSSSTRVGVLLSPIATGGGGGGVAMAAERRAVARGATSLPAPCPSREVSLLSSMAHEQFHAVDLSGDGDERWPCAVQKKRRTLLSLLFSSSSSFSSALGRGMVRMVGLGSPPFGSFLLSLSSFWRRPIFGFVFWGREEEEEEGGW